MRGLWSRLVLVRTGGASAVAGGQRLASSRSVCEYGKVSRRRRGLGAVGGQSAGQACLAVPMGVVCASSAGVVGWSEGGHAGSPPVTSPGRPWNPRANILRQAASPWSRQARAPATTRPLAVPQMRSWAVAPMYAGRLLTGGCCLQPLSQLHTTCPQHPAQCGSGTAEDAVLSSAP